MPIDSAGQGRFAFDANLESKAYTTRNILKRNGEHDQITAGDEFKLGNLVNLVILSRFQLNLNCVLLIFRALILWSREPDREHGSARSCWANPQAFVLPPRGATSMHEKPVEQGVVQLSPEACTPCNVLLIENPVGND
jgi:hypothetical protein